MTSIPANQLALLAVVLLLGHVAAQGQQPSCKVGQVDMTNAPMQVCPGMTQMLDGAAGSPYDITFGWCQSISTSACSTTAFAQQSTGTTCSRGFTTWNSGMSATGNGVKYQLGDGTGSTLDVTVNCAEGQAISCPSSYNVATIGNNMYGYSVTIGSKYACAGATPPGPPGPDGPSGPSGPAPADKGGVTGGGVFLIIFFVGGFMYLALGFAYNFKMKELRGVEAVPNVEFWKDLPSLCKDGCVYFGGLCKSLFEKVTGRGGGASDGAYSSV